MMSKYCSIKKKIVIIGSILCICACYPRTPIMVQASEKGIKNELNADDTSLMQKSAWPNGGVFDCVWSPSNITFQNGIMKLALTENADRSYSQYKYAGAEYRTKETYGYGTYRVSMKPIRQNGVISSFFSYTGPANGTIHDEIDIEFLGKDTTMVQFGTYADGVNESYCYDLGFDASAEWHSYGFRWTAKAVEFMVDEKVVYTITDHVPVTEQSIMMNVWNAVPTSDMITWVGEYNGTTPLYAYYDDFSYVSEKKPIDMDKIKKLSLELLEQIKGKIWFLYILEAR